MTYDAIVIGAGVNGLVAAAYLARAGRRVLMLEQRETAGGIAELASGADAAWLPPRITRDLGLARRGLKHLHPEPYVCTPLPDGRHLLLWRDPARTAAEIRKLSPADAARWPEFSTRMARLAGFLEVLYSAPPPDVTSRDLRDLVHLVGLGRRLRGLGKTGMIDLLRTLPMSVAELLDDWFESDALKGTLGAAGISGLRQGPRSAGTAFVFLHHHVGARGWGLGARDGGDALVPALVAAARARGVEIRTRAEVARIVVRDGGATGVALATGEEIPARVVLSGPDPRRTFLSLVEPGVLAPEFELAVRNIKFRGATAFVTLTLSELLAFPAPVLSISPSLDYLERAYDDAKYGRVSARPYLAARLVPGEPATLRVQVQYAPYTLKEGRWDEARRAALGDAVVATLAEYAPDLPRAILDRQIVTPEDIEARYGASEGSLYHGELTLDQILFMRPVPECAHYRTPIRGLYLCGAGTHPGGGIAGGPGRNAAQVVLKEANR